MLKLRGLVSRYGSYVVPNAVPMLTGRCCISCALVLQFPFALQIANAVPQGKIICRWPRSAPSRLERNLQRGLGRQGIPYHFGRVLAGELSGVRNFVINRLDFQGEVKIVRMFSFA